MKINLHTIAKRISSSKEMKKKKLEIKKRKWKNKTKQKKNKITTTQWASDIHWTSRGRLIPTGKDYFKFVKMGANLFLIEAVITNRGRFITNGAVFLVQVGATVIINWGSPHYYKSRMSYYKGTDSYYNQGNYCKSVPNSCKSEIKRSSRPRVICKIDVHRVNIVIHRVIGKTAMSETFFE